MKVIKFAPGLIPVLKHQEHDQSSHGSWANGTDVWSVTDGKNEKVFSTKDGTLKVKIANSFMSNPEYKETIKKTLDTVEKLQGDFPIKGEIYFQEGDFVTGTNNAWATTMNVSEGGRTSSQMTLTEGLLKPTARKDFLVYTITHEWGHAIDRRSSERALQAIQSIARSENAPMTKYGFRNGREAFAEAFAVKYLRSHEGGILSEDVLQDPKWERTFNILEVPSVVSKATDEKGFSFFVADTFDPDNPPVLIEDYKPPVEKHGNHDQSSHGNWAEGSQGSVSELSDDEIRDVIYNSKTVNEMFHKVADRLGKSMKPSVDNLSEDEITHYRGVPDTTRDAQRLLDGNVKFTEFQTWGQGIYLAEEKDIASNYGTLIGMRLDPSAKIVKGETAWDSAFEVNYDNPSARTRNTTTSDFIDLARIETTIRAGKMDNLSISDMRNIYWAAKGYDGFTTYGETVLFNGSKLTVNKADIGDAVRKHQQHDQKTHGNWATGGEISTWNPTDPIPESPRNAGGMTAKAWEAWEHGPDGQNFIALFRKYACQELGLEVPKTPFDQGGYLNYMMDRGWGKPSREEAKGMLNAIANGKPQPALYRGMTNSSDPQDQASLDALLSTKPGDIFDMPLVSTTRSIGVATWYAADVAGVGQRSVVMKIQEGAKGVALKKENSTYPQDHEVITSGKFEVVSINKVTTPYWSRSIFEPRKTAGDDQYPDFYEVATYDKTRFSPEYAKIAYEAVKSGNYKSLETPTFKLTPDRSGGDLSSWTKQEGKEFTVIEVKMVEPHTVQKAKDFGNEFFFLFNNMPFIHDDLEDMQKHGNHDQKTHGSWATGNYENLSDWIKEELSVFNSDAEREKYIEDTINSQHISAYDNTKYSGAIETYEGKIGYDLNEALRDPQISDDGYMGTVQKLDDAISAIEPISQELIAYRGVKGNGLDFFEKLKTGDTYTDKGFTSTTIDPYVAKQFGGVSGYYEGIVFKYKFPAGTKGIFPGAFTDKSIGRDTSEAEFLLPRNSKFKITAQRGKVWDVELVP